MPKQFIRKSVNQNLKTAFKWPIGLIILSCALIICAMLGMGIMNNGISFMNKSICSNITGAAWLCSIASAIIILDNWRKNIFLFTKIILLLFSMGLIAFSTLVIFLIE